jgi:transposase-like protein
MRRTSRSMVFENSSIGRWTSKAKLSVFVDCQTRCVSEVPDTVTMDKSGANKAALDQLNVDRYIQIKVRQVKCLNNIV